MSNNLIFFAGKKARIAIQEKGLQPDMVKIVPGAAGGPKWLVLNQLDRTLFSTFFSGRKKPLYLIGSSIGAWRFSAVSQMDAQEGINRFEFGYIENQRYSTQPTHQEIKEETNKVLNSFIDDSKIDEILHHPYLRLNITAVRCKGLTSFENLPMLGSGLISAAMCNLVSRKALKYLFERVLFYHPEESPPFLLNNEFPIQKVVLNAQNLKSALLASGAIPIVMPGIKNIVGTKKGLYRDGGIIDYHMDLDYSVAKDEIVLFPHYMDRIIPGWLDKKLSWRKPDPSHTENMLLVAPSKEFVEQLPFGKIPDRNDFKTFVGRDEDRIRYWRKVVDESKKLADEFMETVNSGKIRSVLKPL